MKDAPIITNFLFELKGSAVFTQPDLDELEDHLSEELNFQSAYYELEEAQERSIESLGNRCRLVAMYRRKNAWKIIEEQFFYLFSGAFFFVLLQKVFMLWYMFLMAVLQPTPDTLMYKLFPLIPINMMIVITYGLYKWVGKSEWTLDVLFKRSIFLRQMRWLTPLAMVFMLAIMILLGPLIAIPKSIYLFSFMGLSLIGGAACWFLVSLGFFFNRKRGDQTSINTAWRRLSFFTGPCLYICIGISLDNILSMLPKVVPAVFWLLLMVITFLSGFLMLAFRRGKARRRLIH